MDGWNTAFLLGFGLFSGANLLLPWIQPPREAPPRWEANMSSMDLRADEDYLGDSVDSEMRIGTFYEILTALEKVLQKSDLERNCRFLIDMIYHYIYIYIVI